MFNPDTAVASAYMPSFETAARSLKVEPIMAPVHSAASRLAPQGDDGRFDLCTRPLEQIDQRREAVPFAAHEFFERSQIGQFRRYVYDLGSTAPFCESYFP